MKRNWNLFSVLLEDIVGQFLRRQSSRQCDTTAGLTLNIGLLQMRDESAFEMFPNGKDLFVITRIEIDCFKKKHGLGQDGWTRMTKSGHSYLHPTEANAWMRILNSIVSKEVLNFSSKTSVKSKKSVISYVQSFDWPITYQVWIHSRTGRGHPYMCIRQIWKQMRTSEIPNPFYSLMLRKMN